MDATSHDELFRDCLVKLRAGWNEVPWARRLEIAELLQKTLLQHMLTEPALELVRLLAFDPKWEVRYSIAGAIHELPEADFRKLAEILGADQHAYVRRTVARAVRFRQKESRKRTTSDRAEDCVALQLASIEKQHGKRAATQALRLCNQYSGLLVGAMVHDLHSIMTGLSHCSFGVLESTKGQHFSAEVMRYRQALKRHMELLSLSIADMEAFSQDLPQSRTMERLVDVVQAALTLARENVQKSGLDISVVTVEVSVPGNLRVSIARHQIVMALTNLLKNSLEAFVVPGRRMRPGRITVAATQVSDMVSVVIADNGMGLSDAETRGLLIFTPARRNKTKPYSTGYGVPIAARNIFAHGGTFQLDSTENVGTTATLTLPVAENLE